MAIDISGTVLLREPLELPEKVGLERSKVYSLFHGLNLMLERGQAEIKI